MNTATSETLIDRTVKPISRAPFERRLARAHAVLDVAIDVLHHHDGVVDHEADRDGQRHQRQIVEAEAEQIHHRGGAQQRQRHRRRPGSRWRGRCAGTAKITITTSADGQRERELDVVHRGADGLRAVDDGVDLHRRRDRRAASRGSAALIWSTVSITLAPGCLNTSRITAALVVVAQRRRC